MSNDVAEKPLSCQACGKTAATVEERETARFLWGYDKYGNLLCHSCLKAKWINR